MVNSLNELFQQFQLIKRMLEMSIRVIYLTLKPFVNFTFLTNQNLWQKNLKYNLQRLHIYVESGIDNSVPTQNVFYKS